MTAVKRHLEYLKEGVEDSFHFSFHPTFYPVREKIQKAIQRFPLAIDDSVFNDLLLFYLLATKEYLDHRTPSHLFRSILSIHIMQKKLLRAEIFSPHQRDLKIRWIPTNLFFPFASKSVLGCLIGFNLMDRYELFDEENILLALQKHLPQLRLVRESGYCHNSRHRSLKIFYLEIEKKGSSPFLSQEITLLKGSLEEKLKNSIQMLSPSVFMKLNEEEVYKHILVLSREIQATSDLPQAYIAFDQQTSREIIFRVSLVYISPSHRFALKERFFDCSFVTERASPVKLLDGHPVEAHIFRLSFSRDPALLRSDGSLDFYSARRKVVALMTAALGEFRDYNGGILIKQQELLDVLKENFSQVPGSDPELIESFFYALIPLEKQVLLRPEILSSMFTCFLEGYRERLPTGVPYSLKIYRREQQIFFVVRGEISSFSEVIKETLQSQDFNTFDVAYNTVTLSEGALFTCALLQPNTQNTELLLQEIQDALNHWHQKLKEQQVLRIALEYNVVSLDPRIGGEVISGDILRFLFEGLTRFNQEGKVENGVAESIEISPSLKQYIFKLRPSFWNDGSPLTAYDYEYSWKKILSPSFETSFADYFYRIKNAKEAKEGRVSLDEVGIQVIDDRTLKVELIGPTPHFLQWTSLPLFSPVHRFIDQQHPQWPYQASKDYPCNGPFQLKMNQPNQGYQLIKNPYYWDTKQVKLDQIVLTVMNPSQAMQAFQKREVNWIGNPFGGWHPSYNPGKQDKVLTFPNSLILSLAFNVTLPPFNHPKIRKAFSYAIQRAQIIENAFMPLNPAYSILLPHYREKDQSVFPQYNPKLAIQYFHEGLQELGINVKDLPPLSIIYLEKGIREHVAVCLKQQFEECFKIPCNLKSLPWTTVFNKMSKGQFQMGFVHWASWIDDPIYTLNAFKFKDNKINFSKWEHPEFQRLLNLSEQEATPFQRSLYLLQAEELLSQEMPVTPLFFQPSQALVNEELHVVYRAPSGPFNAGKSFYKSKANL
jgi:oligopeptide transport system substrate-binding protein